MEEQEWFNINAKNRAWRQSKGVPDLPLALIATHAKPRLICQYSANPTNLSESAIDSDSETETKLYNCKSCLKPGHVRSITLLLGHGVTRAQAKNHLRER